MQTKCLLILIGILLAASCDSWEAVDLSEREYAPYDDEQSIEEETFEYENSIEEERFEYVTVTGHCVFGFENSYFYPCGSSEAWWVSGSAELPQRYYKDATKRGERIYVELSGKVSEPGRYGHMGGGRRSFEVDRILEIRKTSNLDCK